MTGKHLPGFSIDWIKPLGVKEPIMQGWALPKDQARALAALRKAYPKRTLELN